jgi:hypothetical protein
MKSKKLPWNSWGVASEEDQRQLRAELEPLEPEIQALVPEIPMDG